MTSTDIPIPPAVVEAMRVAWLESASDYRRLDESLATALRAGLAAWPGMYRTDSTLFSPALILPLPENSNDKA